MTGVITARIHRNDDRFGGCYTLLRKEFGTDELDTAERVAANLDPADSLAPQGFLIGRFGVDDGHPNWDAPIGVIDGDYLPLPGGGGVGALGHLVTTDGRRGEGHGAALVLAWERAVQQHSLRRHERLRLLVLESRPSATAFWAERGYRWVAGSDYHQPAISTACGPDHPDGQPVPELLMVKPVEVSADVDTTLISTALISEAVFAMYRHWYEPPCTGYRPDAWARITAELWGTTFPTFLSSLPTTPRSPLTQPPIHHTAAPTAA